MCLKSQTARLPGQMVALAAAILSISAGLAAAGRTIPICAIQGRGFGSLRVGDTVTTEGVVVADLDDTPRRGFFLQDGNCDADPNTSDGLFVFLGQRGDWVRPGDRVEVTGLVQETRGMTELQAAPAGVIRLSTGEPLPEAVELSPPFDSLDARYYFEGREGMLARLESAVVVGPTDADDRTWLVSAGLGIERVHADDPQGTGEIVCADDEGPFEIIPEVRAGERLRDVQGVLDYQGGVYCLELIRPPALQPVPPGLENKVLTPAAVIDGAAAAPEPGVQFTLATFNLHNLFDPEDDPDTDDPVLSPGEFQRRLQKRALAIHEILREPDILAVQEVENRIVLRALLNRPELEAEYEYVWEDGPDALGMDVALLYRAGRAELLGYEVRQGCTGLVDGLGPDGNRDPAHPQNLLTCDRDGDGFADGNRLFSRPSLLARLRLCDPDCEVPMPARTVEIWVLVNHWKAKTEDLLTQPYTLPRRIEQAAFVAEWVGELIAAEPETALFVVGDLNDAPVSKPLALLAEKGLFNLWSWVEKPDRYNYIYQGVSQALDHILVHLPRGWVAPAVVSVHINADYPAVFAEIGNVVYRSSDHDPLWAEFRLAEPQAYLPAVHR